MAIDDELDAIRGQYPEDSANLGLSLGLKLLSSLPDTTGLLFKIWEVLRSHFFTIAIWERLKLLFDALEKMVRRMDRLFSDVEERLNNREYADGYGNVANIAICT